MTGLLCLVNTLVLTYVLAQSANTTFLLANGEFQLFVELLDACHIPGTEKIKQKGGYLSEIAECVLYLGTETFIFGALDHKRLLPNGVTRWPPES